MAFLIYPQRQYITGLIVMVALLIFPVAHTAAEIKVSDLPKESIKPLYLAQQALQEKKFDEAIKIVTEYMAVAQEPIPQPAFLILGYAYYSAEDVTKALRTFEKGFHAFPDNPEMLQNYAILTYETGHPFESARLFEKLYRLKNKSDKKILYQAAGLYFQAGKLHDAKRVLTELLVSGKSPEDKWYYDMISLCVELKQWDEAEKWAEEYLSRRPGHAKYWRLLAQMQLNREHYRTAAATLEIAYRLENPKPGDWLELSDLYFYLNAPLMGVRCIKNAYGDNIPADKMVKIASALARTRRFHEAVKWVDKAYDRNKKASVLLEKGRILYEERRYKEAQAVLEQCNKLDPKNGQAWILSGFTAWNLQNWSKARDAFASAAELPKYKAQAGDAVSILDDLIEAQKRTDQSSIDAN